MRITLEMSDEDGARFVRDNDGWIQWDDTDDPEGQAHMDVVDVDGKGAPQPPECTRVHRTKSKCRLRHHWLPEGVV